MRAITLSAGSSNPAAPGFKPGPQVLAVAEGTVAVSLHRYRRDELVLLSYDDDGEAATVTRFQGELAITVTDDCRRWAIAGGLGDGEAVLGGHLVFPDHSLGIYSGTGAWLAVTPPLDVPAEAIVTIGGPGSRGREIRLKLGKAGE